MSATTSVVPVVLDSVIEALKASPYPYEVFEAWPGPNTPARVLFFGEVTWDEYAIPTIKDGRRQRQEEVSVAWEQWTFGGSGSPTNVRTVREDAFGALSHFEDLLAEDPTGGATFAIVQGIELAPETAGPAANDRGWVYRIAGSLRIRARLT